MEWSLFGTIVLQILITAIVVLILVLLVSLGITGVRGAFRAPDPEVIAARRRRREAHKRASATYDR